MKTHTAELQLLTAHISDDFFCKEKEEQQRDPEPQQKDRGYTAELNLPSFSAYNG